MEAINTAHTKKKGLSEQRSLTNDDWYKSLLFLWLSSGFL